MPEQPVLLLRLRELDESAFQEFAGWHAPLLDDVLPELSEAASYSRLWMGAAAAIAAVGGQRGRRAAATGLVAVGVTSAVANLALKGVTRRKRPHHVVPAERRLQQPASTSFPSGHTASAAAFSGVVGADLPLLSAPLNFLAAAVGFSRVYTGVHYPGDVLAGWLLGKAVAGATRRAAAAFANR